MFSYSKIIKESYSITVRNKVLWLFGLFVVGSFNLSFIHISDSRLRRFQPRSEMYLWLNYLLVHPWTLFFLSLAVLVFSVAGLVITNWCRIMLVLGVNSITAVKTPLLGQQIKKSGKYVWPVIKISLFTSGLMLLIAAALLGPSLVALRDTQQPGFLVTLGIFLFIPLAFMISCFNIFTGLYVVLFGKSFGAALSLGTDFVAS